jgi:polyhydroxyalkanoate synthase
MGNDYRPFDLLYWNGDTTNLPAKWHHAYLCDLYRDNRLVQPDLLEALGTPIDLGDITTPCYIQAGREDHIAPPESVWRMNAFLPHADKQFVLAGSGHIAGVVNPPAAKKYQYWTHEGPRTRSMILSPGQRRLRAVGGRTGAPGWRSSTPTPCPRRASARRADAATR